MTTETSQSQESNSPFNGGDNNVLEASEFALERVKTSAKAQGLSTTNSLANSARSSANSSPNAAYKDREQVQEVDNQRSQLPPLAVAPKRLQESPEQDPDVATAELAIPETQRLVSSEMIDAYCEEDEEDYREDAQYTVGICAMDKKSRSKPMQAILSRLPRKLFKIVIFGDDCILNQPIEQWPLCDALIAFFSSGFPLQKAKEYVALRKPVVVNDLDKQDILMDRRDVYSLLKQNDIPLPLHVFVNRDGYGGAKPTEFFEGEDFIEVDGVRINKPFVEKPVNGENHNIHIYYPMNAGGGCKRLFRKIGNRSSEFDPNVNTVRTTGSYIYEEFLTTQGTDVKVYTVGPHYAHAEARKSPVLDGKVVRDQTGKEVRYPVILSTKEKQMAYKVCRTFGQTICGFDILRVQNNSYVCDVNGWSFVKNSQKYYDDCSFLLAKYLEKALTYVHDPSNTGGTASHHGSFSSSSVRIADAFEPEMIPAVDSTGAAVNSNSNVLAPTHVLDDQVAFEEEQDGDGTLECTREEELRCVLAVIRHGDRTPKQKMKMLVRHELFLRYYEEQLAKNAKRSRLEKQAKARASGNLETASTASSEGPDSPKTKDHPQHHAPIDLKIKAVKDLKQLLLVAKQTIELFENADEDFRKFLEKDSAKTHKEDWEIMKGFYTLRDVLERWQLCGINRKVQLKPKKTEDVVDAEGHKHKRATQLLVIIKWGGDLTLSGVEQAERLGQRFRQIMYPGGEDGGLSRLHSTYRHDLKIYTSDEGRVQKTAASFAKGLLELEGDIVPILVGLVLKSKDADSMLDQSGSTAQATIMRVKQKLHTIVHRGDNCSELLKRHPENPLVRSVAQALLAVEQPIKKMERMHKLLGELKDQLHEMVEKEKEHPESMAHLQPCDQESFEVMEERWAKLYRDFYNKKKDTYDLSKIPDIHDCIRYDAMHNAHVALKCTRELLDLASGLAHALVPQEYGINLHEKIHIGTQLCRTLLMKIKDDLDLARGIQITHRLNPTYVKDRLDIKSANRSVRTRLYFTSESHLHTLLNVLRYFRREDAEELEAVDEEVDDEDDELESTSLSTTPEDTTQAFRSTRTTSEIFFDDDHKLSQMIRDEEEEFGPLSPEAKKWIEDIPELCYMTHFVVRVFERFQYPKIHPKRFRIEISLSPGADGDPIRDIKPLVVAPLHKISREGLSCQEFVDYLAKLIEFAEKNNHKRHHHQHHQNQ